MAEHLFGELSRTQQQVAELTAELEQLRALQAELGEAAAAGARWACAWKGRAPGEKTFLLRHPARRAY